MKILNKGIGGGGGGGGTPGGSTTQIQYNNAGAFGGISTFTYDGTTLTTAGRFINSYNATASAPAKAFTGTWFTGGTSTTTKPQVVIEPTGTTSTAWSTSGTGFGVNAASGFTGRLLDLQLNGTSNFSVSSAGQALVPNGSLTNPSYGFSANTDCGFYIRSTNQVGTVVDGVLKHETNAQSLTISGATVLNWSINVATDAPNVGFSNPSTGVVKVTDGSSGDGTISGQHRLVGTAPASATSTGVAGDVRYDASYVYICTATNTWKRALLTTW
jgi:hypothetical protein